MSSAAFTVFRLSPCVHFVFFIFFFFFLLLLLLRINFGILNGTRVTGWERDDLCRIIQRREIGDDNLHLRSVPRRQGTHQSFPDCFRRDEHVHVRGRGMPYIQIKQLGGFSTDVSMRPDSREGLTSAI